MPKRNNRLGECAEVLLQLFRDAQAAHGNNGCQCKDCRKDMALALKRLEESTSFSIVRKLPQFATPAQIQKARKKVARELGLPAPGTLRLGVSVLEEITKELDKGGTISFRNPDGSTRKVKIPKGGLGRLSKRATRK